MNKIIADTRTKILDILETVMHDNNDDNIIKAINNLRENRYKDEVTAKQNQQYNKKCKVDILTAAILRQKLLHPKNTTYRDIILSTLETYIIKHECRLATKKNIYFSLSSFYESICKFLQCEIEPFTIEPENPLISTLKALHSQDGVSKTELSTKIGGIGTSKKTVETYINQIQELYPSMKIEKFQKGREVFYRMPNTLHPIHLTLTMEELGVMMRCLSLAYSHQDENKDYSIPNSAITQIGLNIWSQSTWYAKKKISTIFPQIDTKIKSFVEEIDTYEPGEVLIEDIDQLLLMASKNKRHKITYDLIVSGEILTNKYIDFASSTGNNYFKIEDADSPIKKLSSHTNSNLRVVHKNEISKIWQHRN